MSISQSERAAAIAHIDAIREQIEAASTWLALADLDQPAIMLEDAARSVGAACWELQRGTRASRPRGWLSPGAEQPVSGTRDGT